MRVLFFNEQKLLVSVLIVMIGNILYSDEIICCNIRVKERFIFSTKVSKNKKKWDFFFSDCEQYKVS